MMSKNARVYWRPIPIDIIFNILLLMPAKSIARCRCVCRAWASMLRGPDFLEMFLTRSCAQPQLLFVCQTQVAQYKEVLFFSTPQPQNLDGNSSRHVVVDYRMKFFFDRSYGIVTSTSGLVCFRERQTSLTPALGMVICNPGNQQSITLPKMNIRKRTFEPISFFGYDPVEKHFKVLSMSMYLPCELSQEHQVFTLGTTGDEPSWRMIECGIPHCPRSKAICINGVLFYLANAKAYSPDPVIICFDVRTEKFSFVRVMENFESVWHNTTTLVNYKGKMASLKLSHESYTLIGVIPRTIEMCVLEDPEKHEWSKHIYKVPHLWPVFIGEEALFNIAGVVADTNEVVFSRRIASSGPFYVYYYSLERQTMRRVEIKGLRAGKDGTNIQVSVNHVENVRFM